MEQIPILSPNEDWSVNMSYLSPAYMANFRPAYKDRLKREAREVSESKTARR